MINANDDWGIIEAAYSRLQEEQGLPAERPADTNTLTEYDYADAIEQTAYEITNARYPELAMLTAFAQNGYLDNDPVWYQIGDAVARALEAYADERKQDFEDSQNEPDEYWA